MSDTSKSIDEVLREEIADISKRREKHDQPEPINPHDPLAKEGETNGLTGLALSGGGVRSAAFCLGFIQGMYSAGRMKAFDFLSTVSGGGYAGALFSSDVAKQTSEIDWERSSDPVKNKYGNRLDIEREPDGSQSERVARLSMHGRMMTNLLRLFSRHLWGLLVNIAFVFSGVVAIAAVLAYFGRLPWGNQAILYLRELKFNDDFLIPFFYSFIAFVFWLLSHFVAYVAKMLNRKIPALTQYSYLLLIASVILGFVSLLALEDVSLATITTNENLSPNIQEDVNQFLGWVSIALGGLLVVALLPYFSPRRLIKSGRSDAGSIQRVIFSTAGRALLVGAPLAIFFLLVREDISGQSMLRKNSDQFVVYHVQFLDRFIPELESEAFSDDPARNHLARRLFESMHGDKLSMTDPTKSIHDDHGNVTQFMELFEARKADDRKYGFVDSWMQWLADSVQINEDFSSRVERNVEIRNQQAAIVNHLNVECLSDPYLFLELREKHLQPVGSKRPFYNAALRLYEKIAKDLRAARGERRQETDRAEELLALLKLESHADKDNLLRAIKNLESATQQLEKQYSAVGQSAVGQPAVSGETPTASVVRRAMSIVGVFSGADLPQERTPNQHVRAATIQLAVEQINGSPKSESTGTGSGKIANQDPGSDIPVSGSAPRETGGTLTGPYLTRLQKLFHDKESLERNVEKFVNDQREQREGDPFSIPSEEKETYEKQREKHANRVDELARDVRENNWILLAAMYPDFIRPQTTTFAYVVNAADQQFRIKIFVVAVFVFLATGLLTNLNSTSLHGVYRDQLAEIWLGDPNMPLNKLNTCAWGAPYHIINGTANRMGQRNDPDLEGKSRFVFTHRYCGTKKIGYRDTNLYQDGDTSLADAVAISGAAVTSITVPTFLHQLIMFLTNFRLGQWLPNTQSYQTDFYWPSPVRCFSNIFWYPEQRSYIFVSDGGHLDNTGLATLLERRCRFMICVDGGHDPEYKFLDLRSVLHAARAKYGISARVLTTEGKEFPTTEWLKPITPDDESGISEKHFVVFEIDYPDREYPAILIYSKLTVTDNEPLEIVQMARTEQHYPHDPTTNQFLDAPVFDAYLTLGRCIAQDIDQFVSDGGLDDYRLPLGWCSERTSIDPTLRELQDELQNRSFDREGIKLVSEKLQAWCQSASKESGNLDSSLVNIVSSWARDKGLEASADLRSEFCDRIGGLSKDHMDLIRRDKDVVEHFSAMLSALGGRTKATLDVLRALAATQDLDAELQELPFDKKGIKLVTGKLQQWCESAAKEPGKLDSSPVDIVSSWAREKGLDAKAELRGEFCRQVSELLKESMDVVRRDDEAVEHFSVMLSALGGRSKATLDLLRQLGAACESDEAEDVVPVA